MTSAADPDPSDAGSPLPPPAAAARGRPTGLRTALGLSLAVLAVLLAAPPTVGPGAHWLSHALAPLVRGVEARHPELGHLVRMLAPVALASALLLPAALLLPGTTERAPRRPELLPLGLGCLLLLEPLVHLVLLGFLAISRWAGSSELILPAPMLPEPLWRTLLLVAVIAGLAPMVEELFFRVRLLPWLKSRFGSASAVTLSSLLFACAHAEPRQALVALPVGLLLGTLRVRGASWSVCVLVHQAHNTLFLLAGIGLISDPWISVALAGGGLACLLLASWWPGRSGWLAPGPAAVLVLVLAAVIVLLQPALQRAQDRCWLAAMHRLTLDPHIDPLRFMSRLDEQLRAGRLDDRRRTGLGLLVQQDLAARPLPGDPDVMLWEIALLTPEALVGQDDDQVASTFERLAICPIELPEHDAAAQLLGRAHPELFASAAIDLPEGLERWMRLPDAAEPLRQQLLLSAPRERQRLLAACERCFPGAVAAVLLSLPAPAVTPSDRLFLRRHYADADQLIARLPPAQATAWRLEPSAMP